MKKTLFDILIPKLSEKIIDCQVARWLKSEGDFVVEGDVIVELETEKTTIEIESPCDGILAGIYVFEGEEVIDGERIGIINAEEAFDILGDDDDSLEEDLEDFKEDEEESEEEEYEDEEIDEELHDFQENEDDEEPVHYNFTRKYNR